jgi:hypothetical protein
MIVVSMLSAVALLAAAYIFFAARAEAHRQEWRRQNRAYNLK